MRGARVSRVACGLAALGAACAPSSSSSSLPTEDVGTSRAAIIKGVDSTPEQDAVVLIKHYDAVQIGGGAEGCTGTMLTPRLVLTARHCVAETDPTLACESDGTASFGGEVKRPFAANKLFAFSGVTRPDFLSALDRAARGVEILDDGAKNLCNHDLALILLEKPLPGAKIAPIRLDGGPKEGELVTVIGWGVTDQGPDPAVRKQRAGVKVLGVGPADRLGGSELRVGESGCAGDSGGPALSASGAVIGVLSRGGNGSGAKPGDPAGCIGGENVFTSTSAFRDLVLAAYAKAGQEPWLEGGEDPTTKKAAPPDAPAPEEEGGCAVAASRGRTRRAGRGGGAGGGGEGGFAIAAWLAIAACAVARRKRPSRA